MAGSNGYARIVSQDWSGGMFPALAPELIPANGAFDITNGLLNEQDVVYRRGGSTYLSTVPLGTPCRFLWAGYLKHGGHHTIVGAEGFIWKLGTDGSFKLIGGGDVLATFDAPCVFQGVMYLSGGFTYDGETWGRATPGELRGGFFASAGNRLLSGGGSRVLVSDVPATEGEEVKWTSTNYFSLPNGVTLLGLYGLRTMCVAFTSEGIWLLGGLAKTIVDTNGNIQWSQDRYSADAVLWGNAGVAGWKGGVVVPCKDNVWLMEVGVSSEKPAAFRAISGPIHTVYRSYVAAGYQPGQAVVFNGHYILPIIGTDGVTVIDTLVCRLEGVNAGGHQEFAWTHLRGYGAQVAALTTTVSDTEGPLIGAHAGDARVCKLGYFEPGAKYAYDADGSSVAFELTTRSIPTGQLNPNLVAKARLSYRMIGEAAARMELAIASTAYGAEWGNFNWGEGEWSSFAGPFEDLGVAIPAAGPDPEALHPKVWHPRRKIRYARLRIRLNGQASQASVRALELFARQDGRLI